MTKLYVCDLYKQARSFKLGMTSLGFLIALSGCVKFNNLSDDATTASTSTSTTSTASTAVASCVTATLTVEAQYTGGSEWLDFVEGGDTTTACTHSKEDSCIHAGESRKVTVTGETDCDKLTMTDNLGAFNWYCDDSSGTAVFHSRLKRDKHLRDLIDASGLAFRDNYVSLVSTDCPTATANTSTPGAWWTNDIAALPDNSGGSTLDLDGTNDGGNDAVFAEGTILVLDESRTTPGYNLNRDKLALVITAGNTLTWEDGGANDNGSGAAGTSKRSIVFSDDAFVWFEGNLNGEPSAGTMADYGVHFYYPTTANVRGGTIQNFADTGVYAHGAMSTSVFSDLKIYNTTTYGLYSYGRGSSGYQSKNVKVLNSRFANMGVGLYFSNNDGAVTDNISAFNTTVGHTRSSRMRWNGVVSAGDDYSNISFYDSSYGSIMNSTFALSKHYPLAILRGGWNHRYASVHRIVAVAGNNGIYSSAAEVSFIDVATAHNNSAGFSSGGTGIHHGTMRFGNNGSTGCGFSGTDANCDADGSSTHTAVSGIDLTTTFVGYTSSDSANAQAGQVAYDSITDWLSFDNRYRGWSAAHVDNDPLNPDNRDFCQSGDNCASYDWSLSENDAGNGGSAALLGVLACPSGNDTFTQTVNTTGPVTETYLNRAVEIINDGIGDDDSFCESNESCLYSPNIGAYQGHGAIIASTSCSDIGSGGTVENVKLYEYTTNGR